MASRRTVHFNTGVVLDAATDNEEIVVGVVQRVRPGGNLDIWVPDPSTGAGTIVRDVPRRAPNAPEGNGHTWYP